VITLQSDGHFVFVTIILTAVSACGMTTQLPGGLKSCLANFALKACLPVNLKCGDVAIDWSGCHGLALRTLRPSLFIKQALSAYVLLLVIYWFTLSKLE
jgi:hypothetical protein